MGRQESMPDTITDEEVTQALLRSGYLLESRLATCLRGRQYEVQSSAAFPDPITGVSREMDIFAVHGERIQSDAHHPGGDVYNVILLECINNPQPLAFLITEQQEAPRAVRHIKMAGVPEKVPAAKPTDTPVSSSTPLRATAVSLVSSLSAFEYHHYCKGPVATQWCTFSRKERGHQKAVWMASHEQSHFDDFAKLGNAVDYYQLKMRDLVNGPHPATALFIEFYLPLLVVQGELVGVQVLPGRPPALSRPPHVQFHRSVVVGDKEVDYRIDVVTEEHFQSYLAMTEEELRTTARRLSEQGERVRNGIKMFNAARQEQE